MDGNSRGRPAPAPLQRLRRFVFICLIAIVIGIVITTCLLRSRSAINLDNVQRIQLGMALDEVQEIPGGPPRDDETGPIVEVSSDAVEEPGTQLSYEISQLGDGEEIAGWSRQWAADSVLVVIHFDASNHVTEIHPVAMRPVDRGFLASLRRLLRL